MLFCITLLKIRFAQLTSLTSELISAMSLNTSLCFSVQSQGFLGWNTAVWKCLLWNLKRPNVPSAILQVHKHTKVLPARPRATCLDPFFATSVFSLHTVTGLYTNSFFVTHCLATPDLSSWRYEHRVNSQHRDFTSCGNSRMFLQVSLSSNGKWIHSDLCVSAPKETFDHEFGGMPDGDVLVYFLINIVRRQQMCLKKPEGLPFISFIAFFRGNENCGPANKWLSSRSLQSTGAENNSRVFCDVDTLASIYFSSTFPVRAQMFKLATAFCYSTCAFYYLQSHDQSWWKAPGYVQGNIKHLCFQSNLQWQSTGERALHQHLTN